MMRCCGFAHPRPKILRRGQAAAEAGPCRMSGHPVFQDSVFIAERAELFLETECQQPRLIDLDFYAVPRLEAGAL